MILDTFMNGLINDLFLQKWERFGRKVWSFVLLIDGFCLLCLTTLSFALKLEWLDRHDYASGLLAPVTLVSIGIALALDIVFIICWWQNYEFECSSSKPIALTMTSARIHLPRCVTMPRGSTYFTSSRRVSSCRM